MKWYWWVIGAFSVKVLIVSIFVITIAIRNEWASNIRSTKPDYRRFIKSCLDYIWKGIIFGLSLLPLMLFKRNKGGRKMKWYQWILRKLIGWSLVILTVLLMGIFVLLVEFPELRIILLNKVREMTYIIIILFGVAYLVFGGLLGVKWEQENLVKYRKNKEIRLFICTCLQVICLAISWILSAFIVTVIVVASAWDNT